MATSLCRLYFWCCCFHRTNYVEILSPYTVVIVLVKPSEWLLLCYFLLLLLLYCCHICFTRNLQMQSLHNCIRMNVQSYAQFHETHCGLQWCMEKCEIFIGQNCTLWCFINVYLHTCDLYCINRVFTMT